MNTMNVYNNPVHKQHLQFHGQLFSLFDQSVLSPQTNDRDKCNGIYKFIWGRGSHIDMVYVYVHAFWVW